MITKEATILERPKTALSCRLWVPASMLRALWKYAGDHAEGQRKFDDKGKHTLATKVQQRITLTHIFWLLKARSLRATGTKDICA